MTMFLQVILVWFTDKSHVWLSSCFIWTCIEAKCTCLDSIDKLLFARLINIIFEILQNFLIFIPIQIIITSIFHKLKVCLLLFQLLFTVDLPLLILNFPPHTTVSIIVNGWIHYIQIVIIHRAFTADEAEAFCIS